MGESERFMVGSWTSVPVTVNLEPVAARESAGGTNAGSCSKCFRLDSSVCFRFASRDLFAAKSNER